jgi:DUF1365 family protein
LSAIYSGFVHHTRRKVEGVSPAAHSFRFSVWMALIDLAETKQGGGAFAGQRLVSADGRSWNAFCWLRRDHFSDRRPLRANAAVAATADTPATAAAAADDDDLEACVRRLVRKETGRDTTGRVLLLTNLRCFGLVFNPVSIYYCLDAAGAALEAVVLEVSNTPWLEKRLYVLPFFRDHHRMDSDRIDSDDHTAAPFVATVVAGSGGAGKADGESNETSESENAAERSGAAAAGAAGAASAPPPLPVVWYSHKWKKDFHVSPFFDVFYNYAWSLTLPGSGPELRVRAASTRRPADAAAGLAAQQQRGEWAHATGASPTVPADPPEKGNDGELTFVAGLQLTRVPDGVAPSWRRLLQQPLMTFSVVLYIHVHAAVLILRKGVDYKPKPSNGPELGFASLAYNFAVLAVAALWELLTFVAVTAPMCLVAWATRKETSGRVAGTALVAVGAVVAIISCVRTAWV